MKKKKQYKKQVQLDSSWILLKWFIYLLGSSPISFVIWKALPFDIRAS